MPATHQLEPGQAIRLDQMSPKGKDFCDDRDRAEAEFHSLREELAELQYRFYADGRHKLLIILQAIDAGGKDGTIRRVFRGIMTWLMSLRVLGLVARTPSPCELTFSCFTAESSLRTFSVNSLAWPWLFASRIAA